ncbi:uncharacterized protein LOC128237160 isoform X2 [Mya arenaria]|uniref:uncharacterized protein LOC128237160 isoform X2 n=1 Tax=Mya arenaria TaxID=6604 RepID=UPI0022E91125|nr:uncharacterized protein LOC128237160 isoform X2 [Mya arenaria]
MQYIEHQLKSSSILIQIKCSERQKQVKIPCTARSVLRNMCLEFNTSWAEVRPRQHAVECDSCHRWQHRICGTGISLATYREAPKNEAGLTFVCRPCLQPSTTVEDADMPTLERTMPVEENSDDDSEMPSLNHSVLPDDSAYAYGPVLDVDTSVVHLHTTRAEMPVEENSDDDSAMPSLNPSVLPDDSAYAYDTVLDDDTTVLSVVDMHIIRDELSDIDDHVLPVLNSTAFDESYYSFYTGTDASHKEDISFDVTGRNVAEVVPVVEQSHYGALTETILENRGITWTVIDGGSQRGSKVLISSLGYAYGVKRENKASTIWRCTSRSKSIKCKCLSLVPGGLATCTERGAS